MLCVVGVVCLQAMDQLVRMVLPVHLLLRTRLRLTVLQIEYEPRLARFGRSAYADSAHVRRDDGQRTEGGRHFEAY